LIAVYDFSLRWLNCTRQS